MNVYATYSGAEPRVINWMLWIPGETHVIDDRLLQLENLGETEVTTAAIPEPPSDTSVILEPGTPEAPPEPVPPEPGAGTTSETGTGTDQVVVTQYEPPAPSATAQSHSEPTTPRTKKG